jgi:hypothetical protein
VTPDEQTAYEAMRQERDGWEASVEAWREQAEAAEATVARLTATLKDVTEGMDREGCDGYAMPRCPWCQSDADDNAHNGDCSLVKARDVLAALSASSTPDGSHFVSGDK